MMMDEAEMMDPAAGAAEVNCETNTFIPHTHRFLFQTIFTQQHDDEDDLILLDDD